MSDGARNGSLDSARNRHSNGSSLGGFGRAAHSLGDGDSFWLHQNMISRLEMRIRLVELTSTIEKELGDLRKIVNCIISSVPDSKTDEEETYDHGHP